MSTPMPSVVRQTSQAVVRHRMLSEAMSATNRVSAVQTAALASRGPAMASTRSFITYWTPTAQPAAPTTARRIAPNCQGRLAT
jgi:hypothetical protein